MTTNRIFVVTSFVAVAWSAVSGALGMSRDVFWGGLTLVMFAGMSVNSSMLEADLRGAQHENEHLTQSLKEAYQRTNRLEEELRRERKS